MKASIENSTKRAHYFILIYLFIFGDVICSNYIIKSFHNQTHAQQLYSFLGLLILQISAAPIQAAISDLHCRKKSLISSLAFSLASLALVYVYIKIGGGVLLVCLIIVLKGLFGNTLPLSLAAIADARNKKIRLSFGLATSPFTAAYFWLVFVNKNISESTSIFMAILIFIGLIFCCILFFEDIRDKTKQENQILHFDSLAPQKLKMEIREVIKEAHNFSSQMAFISYLLWEISLYSILLLYIDFNEQTFSSIGIAMLCGALVAVFVLKIFQNIDDTKMIKWGYSFSAFSLIPFFLIYPFFTEINFYFLTGCYFFHTMGNILLSASLLGLMAKRASPHQCGRLYGLLDSVDTIAFLIASIFLMMYNFLQIKLIYLILFSYVAVTISWIPYAKFKKSKTAGN